MDTHPQRDFLVSVLPLPLAASPVRPHVTLTYAQSLDGCIAGLGGKQLILSGKESMVMTHWCCSQPVSTFNVHILTSCFNRLRTMHDGILVGIGTALNDDPQLNGKSPSFFL